MSLHDLLADLQASCTEIDAAWAAAGRGLEPFPDIVREHTARLDLTPFGALEDLVELLEEPAVADYQRLSSFSDLYLRIFDNGRFWVEILNWWGSDINIHDHDFSGVQFQLKGDTFNFLYDVEATEVVEGVSVGEIRLRAAERWVEGGTSVVLPGRLAPHNACHIGMPTVSLLIRTHPRPSYGPQWNYFPPSIAASYGVADVCFRKRVGALRLLSRGEDPRAFHRAFRDYVRGLSLNQVLFVLVKMIDVVFESAHVELILELAESGRPRISEVIRAAASHRAAEIVKSLRWDPRIDAGDREVIAVLGSSFDVESARLALRGCGLDSCDLSISHSVGQAASSMPSGHRRQFLNALKVFGMARWASGNEVLVGASEIG